MSLRSRRWAVSAMLLVAFLAAIFFFLFFSASGSQLVWNQLTRWVPGLQGEWVSGSLADGWQLRDTRWQSDSVTVSLKHVQTRWQLVSLLSGQAEIDLLEVDGLTVSRRDMPDSADVADVVPEVLPVTDRYIPTPVSIMLHQLKLSGFVYDDPVVRVKVGNLETVAEWQGHQIDIEPSHADSVDVWLKPAAVDKDVISDKKNTASSKEKMADTELPEVFVPFDIRLAGLSLKQGRYHQQAFDTGLMDITLQARFDGTELTVKQLQVQQEKRRAGLSGKMTFIQNYLIDADLNAQSAIPVVSPDVSRNATLSAKGDLQKLKFTALLEGKEKVKLQGELQPLTNGLPFVLMGDWLTLPLPPALEGLTVGKGKLDLRGSLQNYKLALETEGKWLDLPSTWLQLALNGSSDRLDLQRLQLGDGVNKLLVAGQLNWQKGLHWQGQTELELPEVKRWLPEAKAAVSGSLKQEIHWLDERWQGDLSAINLKGDWNGFPLTTQGAIQGDEQGNWHFQQIEIKNGPNSLAVNGNLDKEWSLAGKLRLPKLSLINPQWDGSIDGDFRLNGPAKGPVLALRLAAPRIIMPGQLVRKLELTGQATLNKALPGQLQLNIERWNINGTRLQNVALSLRGNAQQHQLLLKNEGKQLSSNLKLAGSWQNGIWQGRLQDSQIGGLAGEWQLLAPTVLQWKASTLTFKSHCWRSEPAKLCFENASLAASQGSVPFSVTNFDTQRLKPWLPDTLKWSSALQANGVFGWRKGSPDLHVSLRSQYGELITEQIHTPYRDMQLKLEVTPVKATGRFVLDSAMLGNINVDAEVRDPLKRRVLSGTVNVSNLQLYGIAPLVDVLHSTKGQVDINGRLAGTLDVPLFYGQVNLKDGEVDTATEMVSLRQINGKLIIEGDKAELNADMLAGKGKVTLTGRSRWPGGHPSGQLSLQGRAVEVAFAGYGNGQIDSDLQLQFDAEKVSLEGDVLVPWARIDIKSLPENGIEVSDDVHIVRPLQQQQTTAPFPFFMDLRLKLGTDVRFSAMGLKTALAGGLRFRQKPGQALLTQGEIRLVDGRFKAYGQNLVVRSGKLMFSGDITEPYVMAEAIRDPATMEDSSVTVGVKINAPISAISAQVFSEPDLPDTDKLSYLLRGRSSTATTNGSTEEAMAAMMISAGLGQTNGIVSDVASTFGLKDAAFDTTGSGTDTKVNLSAYLLKDLQLQYGVGVYDAVSEVKLRYFLLPQLYLQAVSGLSQAVDIFYKFEF